MSVFVSFVSVKGVGSIDAPAVSDCRLRETLVLGGTTSGATAEGEIVFVLNDETTPVFVAFGTTPNSASASKTAVTSAGIPVPSGGLVCLNPPKGSKLSVGATS